MPGYLDGMRCSLTGLFAFLLVAGCESGDPGACRAEGEGYDEKALAPGPCCEGLTAANTSTQLDSGGVCTEEDLNPAKVCILCGDGVCGAEENACSCAEDCGG